MRNPNATVRLQLHAGFTLDDAHRQVPYFAALGVSHYYLSPITCAVPGSTHGYDVVDSTKVNPELGGEQALWKLADALKGYGMGILLDIVPNHMATHSANAWWWDVLKNGAQSQYARWFDINWESDDTLLYGKVLAPFLGGEYDDCLQSGDLRLAYDEEKRAYVIDAGGAQFPIAEGTLDAQGQRPAQLLQAYDATLSEGRHRLDQLLQRQHYRLCDWRRAAYDINWRRFFEISGLIGVRVEEPEVFEAVHALPLRLYAEGIIDGLRVDHVDGLAQPLDYCARLRQSMRGCRPSSETGQSQPWVVVEKILAPGEILDKRWQVNGTTGYDFMDEVGAVFHDAQGAADLLNHWRTVVGSDESADEFVHEARALMVERHFVAETGQLLRSLYDAIPPSSALPLEQATNNAFKAALESLLIYFPVYRTYLDDIQSSVLDLDTIRAAAAQASERWAAGSAERLALQAIESALTTPSSVEGSIQDRTPPPREWVRRFQQLTPPLAAKSLEDTVFYRYGPLLSRNEVGSDPAVLASTIDEFHAFNSLRRERFGGALSATATHDHKRGEDARARLAVLSQLPDRWQEWSRLWRAWTASVPLPNTSVGRAERYMLWQTLVAAWPLSLRPDDSLGVAQLGIRVAQWQRKALREAKLNSSWFEPNVDYELHCAQYIHELLGWKPQAAAELAKNEDIQHASKLDHDAAGGLVVSIFDAVQRIAPVGAINSLSQTVLRLTSPGVPDLYQGTEWWDFSLVDPDNRREVDYAARASALPRDADTADFSALLRHWRDGRIKQALIQRLLGWRTQHPKLFAEGDYIPAQSYGKNAARLIAFARLYNADCILVVVPRLCMAKPEPGSEDPLQIDMTNWDETGIMVPALQGRDLHNLFTQRQHHLDQDGRVRVDDMLATFPCAVLVSV